MERKHTRVLAHAHAHDKHTHTHTHSHTADRERERERERALKKAILCLRTNIYYSILPVECQNMIIFNNNCNAKIMFLIKIITNYSYWKKSLLN
jgi:hypothetical protein